MMMHRVVAVTIAILLSAPMAHAQGRPRRHAAAPGSARQENREELQQRVQRMVWQATKRRVGLTDEQMTRLAPVHQRFQSQRTTLMRDERATRVALRRAMRDTTQVDQNRISGYLDQLVQLQRRRADLLEDEQRELAKIMTPAQRARYTALQEQIRRRIEQLRRQNALAPDSAATPSRP